MSGDIVERELSGKFSGEKGESALKAHTGIKK
jgi:hypothetical protein